MEKFSGKPLNVYVSDDDGDDDDDDDEEEEDDSEEEQNSRKRGVKRKPSNAGTDEASKKVKTSLFNPIPKELLELTKQGKVLFFLSCSICSCLTCIPVCRRKE